MMSPLLMQLIENIKKTPPNERDERFNEDLVAQIQQHTETQDSNLVIDEVLPLIGDENTQFRILCVLFEKFFKKHSSDVFEFLPIWMERVREGGIINLSKHIIPLCNAFFPDNEINKLDIGLENLILESWRNDFIKSSSESERADLILSMRFVGDPDLRRKIAFSLFLLIPFDDPNIATRLFYKIIDSHPEIPADLHSLYLRKMVSLNHPVDHDYIENFYIKPKMKYWKEVFSGHPNDSVSLYDEIQLIPLTVLHEKIVKICEGLFETDEMSRVALFRRYLKANCSNHDLLYTEPFFSNIVSLFKKLRDEQAQMELLETVFSPDMNAQAFSKVFEIIRSSKSAFSESLKVLLDPNVTYETLKTKIFDSDAFELSLSLDMAIKTPRLQRFIGSWASRLFLTHKPQYTFEDFCQINIDLIKCAVLLTDMPVLINRADQMVGMVLNFISTLKDKEYRTGAIEACIQMVEENKLTIKTDFFTQAFDKFQGKDHLRIQEVLLERYNPTHASEAQYLKHLIQYLHLCPSSRLYDTSYAYRFYSSIPVESRAKEIPSFVRQLYPDAEILQIEFFNCFLSSINPAITVGAKKSALKKFAKDIQDDTLCLDLLLEALSRYPRSSGNSILSPLDILEIASHRAPATYASIKSALDSITLAEAIAEDRYHLLNDEFDGGLDFSMPLTGIFTYFYLIKESERFFSMLSENGKALIKNSYQCPEDRPYLKPQEHSALLTFGIPALPSMTSLCAYLKEKEKGLPKIATLAESIAKLRKYKEENLADLNDSHKKGEYLNKCRFLELILLGNQISNQDLLEFFKKITSLELAGEESKLSTLFKSRQQELAYLFSEPQGIEEYLNILSNISDGCAANIGTKTNIYILGKLFKDPLDQVVFPYYIDNIFTVYANQSVDILGSNVSGTKVFQTGAILALYLSPPAFIKGLSAELSDDPKKSAELIKSLANREEYHHFEYNITGFEDRAEAESLQTRLASYLIVRQIMKDDLDNEHFRSIKEMVLPLMRDDFSLAGYRGLQNNEKIVSQSKYSRSFRG
jgi:hypothetical protein